MIGRRRVVMSVSVCLCVGRIVCLSVREYISRTTRPIFIYFFCMLPVAPILLAALR